MTTVSPKKGHDLARGNEISEKLMENPQVASLIGGLSTSTDNASDSVKDYCSHRSTLACRRRGMLIWLRPFRPES